MISLIEQEKRVMTGPSNKSFDFMVTADQSFTIGESMVLAFASLSFTALLLLAMVL